MGPAANATVRSLTLGGSSTPVLGLAADVELALVEDLTIDSNATLGFDVACAASFATLTAADVNLAGTLQLNGIEAAGLTAGTGAVYVLRQPQRRV